MISASGLEKSYGDRVLFSRATFQLNPGERYGLVGANGSGKTTLLGILAGDVEPSAGDVAVPKRLRVGVLRQDQFVYEDESVLGVALMGNRELWQAMEEKERILANWGEGSEEDGHRLSELEDEIQQHDGYTAEARAAEILEGLGIPSAVHRDPIHTLSGGFKLRVLLAQVLAGRPDVLLLDEPTNHLDILSIRWLENFLSAFRGPVVVISHDIRFLDNVATHILDVDYRTVRLYHGTYSDFVVQKAEDLERKEKEIAGHEREVAQLQRFVDRFKAKASKARQAQSKAKIIERMADEIEELPPSSRRWPNFRFEPLRDSGKEVLSVEGIRKAFGENQVLHGVDLRIDRGDRVAILGPNGIGKSTLLKILMGRVESDAGNVKWCYETHVGYFAQDVREELDDESATAEAWLWARCPGKDRGYVRGKLGLVLFSGDDGMKKLGTLSGGEGARLVFAKIGLERPNVLVLDEPTNHLDLESIEALVEGLTDYPGTLLFVSHDRWFVREIATRIVEIREDGIRNYPGSYDEYVHACGDDHLDHDTVVLKAKREKKGTRTPKEAGRPNGSAGREPRPDGGRSPTNPRELERRRDELTSQIEAAEARVAEIEAMFCRPGYFEQTPGDEIRRLEQERDSKAEKAERLMEQWEAAERALTTG